MTSRVQWVQAGKQWHLEVDGKRMPFLLFQEDDGGWAVAHTLYSKLSTFRAPTREECARAAERAAGVEVE